ncbi:MAG: cytochrome c-type biosis protein CcmH [Pseudomonadota bacterium]|nr:cytochrome c-type biosis protein CcmH [Pseudomonadota bacterium]
MNKKGAALIALAGFGLGVFVGKGFATFGTEPAARSLEPAAAMASAPAGHPRITERGLGDAVMTTLRMSTAPAANAQATMPGAVPRSGSPSLVEQADDLRRQRKFKEAAEVYERAAAAGSMNADAWADYADALGSAGSSLKGAPADALAKALALDPRHAKALWLKASLEHEEQRYRDAVKTWRNLLAVVPADSSDARIIEANFAEATRLAASQG